MFQDIKTVYIKLDDALLEEITLQTKFPKTNKKRIMKKWFKKFNKTLYYPAPGFHMVGADLHNNALYVKAHPNYFNAQKEVFDNYNSNPELPNMVVVCE